MTTPSNLYLKRQSSEYHPLSPILARTNSSQSRRSSAAYSPVHSRLGSSHGAGGDSLANELGGFGDSLADELGEWDDDEEDEHTEEEDEADGDHDVEQRERDSGIDITSSPPSDTKKQQLGVPTTRQVGHRRKGSDYDGSEYGSESDFEESQLVNASLEARLAEIEALARRGTGETSGLENIIVRATNQFKDLGGQSGIETGVTR
jgi:hypothetical protein